MRLSARTVLRRRGVIEPVKLLDQLGPVWGKKLPQEEEKELEGERYQSFWVFGVDTTAGRRRRESGVRRVDRRCRCRSEGLGSQMVSNYTVQAYLLKVEASAGIVLLSSRPGPTRKAPPNMSKGEGRNPTAPVVKLGGCDDATWPLLLTISSTKSRSTTLGSVLMTWHLVGARSMKARSLGTLASRGGVALPLGEFIHAAVPHVPRVPRDDLPG